jgi:hypothetical protein
VIYVTFPAWEPLALSFIRKNGHCSLFQTGIDNFKPSRLNKEECVMSRRRLKPKGDVVYHHVMTRTAQQKFWLEDPEIKPVFIDLIMFYSQVYYVDVLGYVCNILPDLIHENRSAQVRKRARVQKSKRTIVSLPFDIPHYSCIEGLSSFNPFS